MEKRVVVTGLGTINPIGHNVEETWESIKNKVCGVNEIRAEVLSRDAYKTKFVAEVKNYNPADFMDPKAAKRNDRYTQFAVIAANEAVKDSGITKENTDFERVGIFVSSGMGGLITIQEQSKILHEKGPNRVSPLLIPLSIANMAAGIVAIEHGFKGESISIVTACASSTHAIGEAFKTIRLGEEDVVVVGGSESSIVDIGFSGFENMKALTNATEIDRASIPFDKERSGFVMGEGAGILVLEELEHAKKRGAKIYAEIIGYGATTDAYHMTAPTPDGNGGARAMIRAIQNAKIDPKDIDYINAHGTSTPLNDVTETKAIKTALGDAAKTVMVSSTKSNTGHLLGAAGAVEAILSIKAINDGIVPPTINNKVRDEECDLDIVPNEIRKADIKIAMSNSLGFGGHNASIILKKYEGV